MSGRTTLREVRVGLVVIVALAALVGLMVLATGGPGFLANRRPIDVVFRDGQGLRAGSTVRIAGIDAGRVESVDLAEHEGALRVRVRLSLPEDLARKLRQDAKFTIQAGLTGQSRVNIVSAGSARDPLAPGQLINGVETSFFDPIMEQVGLGPVERSNISHSISKVRESIDSTEPRVRAILASLQETVANLRATTEAVRPSAEATAGHVERLARRLDAAGPRIEASLARLESISAQADVILGENRPNIQATTAGLRDLLATAKDIAETERPRVVKFIENLDGTRARTDRVLYQVDQITGQGNQMLQRNKADMERTVANVRDATDWASKLVQKIYANPFVLSPLYKPTPEDIRVQSVYDTAQVFTKGAQELHDAVKTLESLQAAGVKTPEQQQAFLKLYDRAYTLTSQLNQLTQNLADGLKSQRRR